MAKNKRYDVKGDFDTPTTTATKRKTPIYIAIAVLLAIALGITGWLVVSGKQIGDKKLLTPKSQVAAKTGDNEAPPITDPATIAPSKERIAELTKYAGQSLLDDAKNKGISPLEPIMGVYGANVPIENSLQDAYGARIVTAAPTALRIYEKLWETFDTSGFHNELPEKGSEAAKELYANTNTMVTDQAANLITKYANVLDRPINSNINIPCTFNAMGGTLKDGKLPCGGKQKIGAGEWKMQVNSPSVTWTNKEEYQSSIAVTFVRTLYLPSPEKGKTIIASTPVSIYLTSGSDNSWVMSGIAYEETVDQTVNGTYDKATGIQNK